MKNAGLICNMLQFFKWSILSVQSGTSMDINSNLILNSNWKTLTKNRLIKKYSRIKCYGKKRKFNVNDDNFYLKNNDIIEMKITYNENKNSINLTYYKNGQILNCFKDSNRKHLRMHAKTQVHLFNFCH